MAFGCFGFAGTLQATGDLFKGARYHRDLAAANVVQPSRRTAVANVNRQWVLAKRPHGKVGAANFEYREGRIPKPGDGKVLVKNLYLSFDPTQRGWMEDRPSYLPPVKIGEVMRASSVGEVVVSNHPDFAPGDNVQTGGGWQDYCVAAPTGGAFGLNKLPPGIPLTMPLSVLGVTGSDRLLGHARSRQAEGGRYGAGIRRGRCDRLGRGTDRAHQRLPRRRYRGRRRQVPMAEETGSLRRGDRLQDARTSTLGSASSVPRASTCSSTTSAATFSRRR